MPGFLIHEGQLTFARPRVFAIFWAGTWGEWVVPKRPQLPFARSAANVVRRDLRRPSSPGAGSDRAPTI